MVIGGQGRIYQETARMTKILEERLPFLIEETG